MLNSKFVKFKAHVIRISAIQYMYMYMHDKPVIYVTQKFVHFVPKKGNFKFIYA